MADRWNVEYTDTFAGEANYCWVRRATIARNRRAYDRELMRKAKAAVGITGMRGRKESYGDSIAFYPYGTATVLFINWKESD